MIQEAQGFRDSQDARARARRQRFVSVLAAYQRGAGHHHAAHVPRDHGGDPAAQPEGAWSMTGCRASCRFLNLGEPGRARPAGRGAAPAPPQPLPPAGSPNSRVRRGPPDEPPVIAAVVLGGRSSSPPLRRCSRCTRPQQVLITQFGQPIRVVDRARAAREDALHPDVISLRPPAARLRRAGRGGDPRRPAPADRGQLHPLPHHRPAALLPDRGRDRGRHPRAAELDRLLLAAARAGQRAAAGGAVDRPRADHGRDPPAGERRGAPLRHRGDGCPHPPRRPAGGEHPGHPVAHAVRARARRARAARRGRRGRPQRIRAAADRERTVLLAEAQAQRRHAARPGRAGGDPHLRRCLSAGPGFLPVLAHHAGLSGGLLGGRHAAAADARTASSSGTSAACRRPPAGARPAAAPAAAASACARAVELPHGRGRCAARAARRHGRGAGAGGPAYALRRGHAPRLAPRSACQTALRVGGLLPRDAMAVSPRCAWASASSPRSASPARPGRVPVAAARPRPLADRCSAARPCAATRRARARRAAASPADAQRAPPVPLRDAPSSFAPLARQLLPAVVNISTTQAAGQARANRPDAPEMPQAPPGSPFEEFFRDFFNRNRPAGQGRAAQPGRPAAAAAPRASRSARASSSMPPASW